MKSYDADNQLIAAVNRVAAALEVDTNKVLDDLYEEIKHGDDEHQKWLKDKIEEFKKSI